MEKVNLLCQIPLFKDLPSADIQKLSEISRDTAFDKGQCIFTEGSIGDSLFVIKSGLVRVLKKGRSRNEEVATLSSEQHFGEMALIDNAPRSATIEAVEHTKLIQIECEELGYLLAVNLDFSNRFYKNMAKYLCLRLRNITQDYAFTAETANIFNSYIHQY